MHGWSPFVKFVFVVTMLVFLFDLIVSGDYRHAAHVLYAGATIVMAGEFLAPVVSSAIFVYVHERAGVPSHCGDPVAPSASDWHYAILSAIGTYAFISASTMLLHQEFSLAPLGATLLSMAPWTLPLLFMHMLYELFHFLGHRRNYRMELALQEQEREERRLFLEMRRAHRLDPGSPS